jgi:hypothetical protein
LHRAYVRKFELPDGVRTQHLTLRQPARGLAVAGPAGLLVGVIQHRAGAVQGAVGPERAQRLWRRAGLEGSPDQHPLAYTDRRGQLNLPYATAFQFAQAFAAAEPEPCIHYIQECEDRLRAEGYEPGGRVSHHVLRNMRPAHALVREWTQAGELGLLQKENQRLREVLGQALDALRRAGDEQAANRLDRALHGR